MWVVPCLRAIIDTDDGQPSRGKLTMKPFQHGHLGATFGAPACPEVHHNDLAAESRHRELSAVESVATEVGRYRAGAIPDEVQGLEERCYRRRVGARGPADGDHQQPRREQVPNTGVQASARTQSLTLSDDLSDFPQQGLAIYDRRYRVLDEPLLADDTLRIDKKV